MSAAPRWPDGFPAETVARARALVRPQPPPRASSGEPVWQAVIDEHGRQLANFFGDAPLIVALMHARDEFGREKYGVPLRVGDGRDHRADVLQEALDCVAYAKAKLMEDGLHAAKRHRWGVIYQRAFDFLVAVASAIELEGA